MSKIVVDIETAFDIGVNEGRRQMAKFAISLCEVSSDVSAIKKILTVMISQDRSADELKQLVLEAGSSIEKIHRERSTP